jgi:hypothetical protein
MANVAVIARSALIVTVQVVAVVQDPAPVPDHPVKV